MRGLLGILVLVTAAMAWAASSHARPAARAASLPRPAPTADEIVAPRPDAAPLPDRPAPGADGGHDGAEHEDHAVDVGVLPIESPIDVVPVDVVVVDGETGRVLASMATTAQRGPEGTVEFEVVAPAGYVAEQAGVRKLEAYVSRLADRVRLVEPVRREAEISVRVLDAAGRPAAGVEVTGVHLGGVPPNIVALSEEQDADDEPELPEEEVALRHPMPLARAGPTGGDGWTRVRGVPHLLDERYWIVARRREVEAFTDVVLGAFGERHTAEIRLPVASRRAVETNSAIGLCGGCGGGSRGRGARRSIPAALDVVVQRRDGRMGVGLEVWAGTAKGTTDAAGHVAFERLQQGTCTVEVRDPDFTWSKEQVELRAGERRTFAFHEQPGWTARAVLLDSAGRPVPFARVHVSSDAPVAYVRVEGGVQDLALWTDALGEIRLPEMHHAPVRLGFSYGSRSASVSLAENDPLPTVRLPPP